MWGQPIKSRWQRSWENFHEPGSQIVVKSGPVVDFGPKLTHEAFSGPFVMKNPPKRGSEGWIFGFVKKRVFHRKSPQDGSSTHPKGSWWSAVPNKFKSWVSGGLRDIRKGCVLQRVMHLPPFLILNLVCMLKNGPQGERSHYFLPIERFLSFGLALDGSNGPPKP